MMRVDWLNRPLTVWEIKTESGIRRTVEVWQTVGGDDWVLIEWLDAALEYWLSRQALYCTYYNAESDEVTCTADIDGPWPGGEYEPTWE